MINTKPIKVRGKPVADGAVPAICTPLVGRTRDGVMAEIASVLPMQPDVIEWRVDFFGDIGDTKHVIDTARQLKQAAGGLPLLFTRRSSDEGGERIALAEPDVVELYQAVCRARCVDLIDYELSKSGEAFARLRAISREHAIAMVGSYHNFQSTPSEQALVAKLREAQRMGADVGKVAVMPRTAGDVLTLLAATCAASG